MPISMSAGAAPSVPRGLIAVAPCRPLLGGRRGKALASGARGEAVSDEALSDDANRSAAAWVRANV